MPSVVSIHVKKHGRTPHNLVHEHMFHWKFCLSNTEVFYCNTRMEEQEQEVQQTAFVRVSTPKPVICTLTGNAIATRGITAQREPGRERERVPSCEREFLSVAVVRDKAESSQTPCMINDLWPHCVEAW